MTTNYNQLAVTQTGKRINFDVQGATFATWHPTHLLTGYSWDALTAGSTLFTGSKNPRILVLGLAGGTLVRQLHHILPEATITAVEIDPVIIELGRTFMGLGELPCEIIIGEAYQFLRETNRQFDIVIDDVYRSGPDDVERPLINSPSLLSLWRKPLQEKSGILLANFITDGTHAIPYQTCREALHQAFRHTVLMTPPLGYNTILMGAGNLAAKFTLKHYKNIFTNAHDRSLWGKITMEELRAPAVKRDCPPA